MHEITKEEIAELIEEHTVRNGDYLIIENVSSLCHKLMDLIADRYARLNEEEE